MPINRHAQRSKPLEQRFWEKVDRKGDNECWEWQAYTCPSTGYGKFGVGHPKVIGAHRYSYELHHGAIPPGMVIMHSCDNPKCVNPNHLSAGTDADNLRDMVKKGRSSAGEKCGTAKLSEANVVDIRERYARGEKTAKLVDEFKVSRHQISSICTGRFWPNAPGPLTTRRPRKACVV